MTESPRPLRCAIYTRKSTEEGLNQDFNSLQAQREAGEAYVLSQRQAGWTVLPAAYDDGGFTGANMDRPALRQLLADVEAGTIDCVVVYKVDRLSRSLLDFARLMSVFDRHTVSFVSVTQEFNTTTSLGRLTLHILLSFAQFEREIISERTRDKLSAARRKGKWIGGIPVLGYDVDPAGGRLLVNPAEAASVREIFSVCLESGTLAATLREVQARKLLTKTWMSRGGKQHTGIPFCASSLGRLLGNVLYKGFVCHKGMLYPGEHQPITDTDVWERVNQQLRIRSGPVRAKAHVEQRVLLAHVMHCAHCESIMIPTYTVRRGRRHTYYVCPGAKRQGCPQKPVAAQDLHPSLMRNLEPMLGDQPDTVLIQQTIQRIRYNSFTREVGVTLRDGARFEYRLPIPKRFGVRARHREEKTGRVPRISRLMALAIKFEQLIRAGEVRDYAALAGARQVSRARMSQIMNLANLAPTIQETLLFLPKTIVGPDRLTEKRMREIAHVSDWALQLNLFRTLMENSAP